MIELLRATAGEHRRRTAVITNDRMVSFGELLADAVAFAGALRAGGVERFAIAHQDAATVIALLAGASLAGAEACVYPPLEHSGHAELAARFGHATVVTDPATQLAPHGQAPSSPPQSRPHLVLTTGTTGSPKGARHDWSRLLRPVSRIAPAPGQRWLLAYGLQQFGALQVLLHSVASGATLIAPFPRRPREALAAMRAHAVTHASATPTFWRFVLAELRADGGPVPELVQITLGGEAVPSRLLQQLAVAFPAARISQIYGATEFGNPRSVRDARGGLPVAALGDKQADIELKVLDGELWARSRVGMLGYHGEPPIDPDAWRPTGDLVEVVGDRIAFRGRASEIINVGGVKVHPLPIEERVGAVRGVALARAYGRANALTGEIVAVEVVLATDCDADAVEGAIREACADLPAAARPRSIRIVESIDVAGQKIKRGAPA